MIIATVVSVINKHHHCIYINKQLYYTGVFAMVSTVFHYYLNSRYSKDTITEIN